jgi:uncharacterized protein (TIGR03118 family)
MSTRRWLRRWSTLAVALGAVIGLVAVGPAGASSDHHDGGRRFRQDNLVSDIAGVARTTDPNLVNPWGMSASATSPVWIADNGTDVSTLYTGDVHGSRTVAVPRVFTIEGGAPTGTVFNPTTDFALGATGPALFLFASESGHITAWNQASGTTAHVVATVSDAVYKGLALATTGHGSFLYAANFRAGTIDVFDSGFHHVTLAGSFTDPGLPAGFAPFNVQALNGRLYVTYAKQDADKEDDVKGPGNGFVDVYDTSGRLLRRLVSQGPLNSPWGLVIAPHGFGRFGGDLLIGNFGDGRITAVDARRGTVEGQLRTIDGDPIAIDGLWALRFGNGTMATPRTLLFTAGIADETHGLFGALTPTND